MIHTNLTREEAAARAALVSGVAYDVHLDISGDGEAFVSRTTVRFEAAGDGPTFLDLIATSVERVVLNGRELPGSCYDEATGRIALDGLVARNEVVVDARCAYEHTGQGLHRFVDPVDGAVYLYTQFEPRDAHRVFACFDQPDLKATFALAVDAPAGWEVVSNGAPVAAGTATGHWQFATTPVMSTYLAALIAGPYHVERSEHDGIPLGVYCRQSLAPYLEAGEILDITKAGFDFFHEVFDYRYPFGKYDQLFVPEFNAGAMENAGAVTISETYVFRSKVTDAERERRAETILHEMAHMWFGDLVTMRWWDDLWLNESFATFMSYLAQNQATRFTGAWITFANNWKTWAYRQDQLPSTHPIVADIPDIDAVHANFDGITYAKGAAVLRQLVAWVGEESFLKGVAAYFRRYEWSNTTLVEFLGALEAASGRDLAAWSTEWLERAGVNTLRPAFALDADGRFESFGIEQSAPAEWPTLRSHRVAVGLYASDAADGALRRVDRVELDAVGARTEVGALVGRIAPELVLVNDGDLAYAKIRLDERSLATVRDRLWRLADPLARALCWSALWDMLRDADLAARAYLATVLANAVHETEITVVQSLLRQGSSAALVFGDPANRGPALASLCAIARETAAAAPAGSDAQLTWARTFVGAARAADDLGVVRGLLDGGGGFAGLDVDTDFRWHLVGALASAGVPDGFALVHAEEARDPTDAGRRHAAAARASVPTAAAKEAAWRAIVEDAGLPLATMEAMMGGFQAQEQEALVEPYVERYFDALASMWASRVPEVALSFAESMYPGSVPSENLLDRTDRYLAGPDVPGALARILLEGRDQVARVLRTRALDAAATG